MKPHSWPRLVFLVTSLQVASLSFALPHCQGSQESPHYRSRVQWVPVDVIVLDGKGRPVLNLGQKDFKVSENGEMQEILYFTSRDWEVPDRRFEEVTTAQPSVGAAPHLLDSSPAPKRCFVLLLGRGKHSAFHLTEALTRFVEEDLGPDEPVALVAFDKASTFTTDRRKIRSSLALYGALHEGIEQRLDLALSGMAALYGKGVVPAEVRKDIDRIFEPFGGGLALQSEQAGETKDARSLLQGILYQTHRADFASAVSTATAGMPGSFSATGVYAFENLEFDIQTALPFDAWLNGQLKAKQDLLNLFSVVEYLRFIPGDKHILYFSDEGFVDDGLFLPRLEAENSLASMASDARARIHTFTTEGTDLGSYVSASTDSRAAREAAGAAPLSGSDVLKNTGVTQQPSGVIRASRSRYYKQNGLRELSARTGGQSYIHSDYLSALREILGLTRKTYLLAYQPRESFDTRFRRIEVSVKKKGLRVLSRTGYFATSNPKLYDRESFKTYARTAGAFQYRGPIGDIAFTCNVSDPVLTRNSTRLSVRIHMDLAPDMFSESSSGYVGTVAFTTFVLNESGQLSDQFWKELVFDIKDSSLDRWLAQGAEFAQPFDINTKLRRGRLRIVLYNSRADKLGAADFPFGK